MQNHSSAASGVQLQLEADWDEFCQLEETIGKAESTALEARHTCGAKLLNYESVPGSKTSPLAVAIRNLSKELKVSKQELYYRRQFAEEHPNLSKALDRFHTWDSFVNPKSDDDIDMGGLKESVHVQWYTPGEYIAAARQVMGGIDLDPATSEMANETVQAANYYTEEDDGLQHEWHGNIWLNPPYGQGSGQFTTKLVQEHTAGRTKQAILLLNAYGFDSNWFQPLWNNPICFTNHRIQFTNPDRETGGPANANIFVYLGPERALFANTFAQYGAVVERVA